MKLGKLLRKVELLGTHYHRQQAELEEARSALRGAMAEAHEEGISMAKIGEAAKLTREGVRYALKEASR